MCKKNINTHNKKTIVYLYLLFLCFFMFANSICVTSQNNAMSNSLKSKKDNVTWNTYYNSNKIKILYSYQEDNPAHGYKGEYIIFKVINTNKVVKSISWDFSAIDQDDRCFNCDNNNIEVHFEQEIPSKHNISGNPNNVLKGPLTMFNRFTDEKYKGSAKIGWKSFSLNNIVIK